jgi:hypothetical protein
MLRDAETESPKAIWTKSSLRFIKNAHVASQYLLQPRMEQARQVPPISNVKIIWIGPSDHRRVVEERQTSILRVFRSPDGHS